MIIINAEFFKNDFLLILHEPKYLIITEDNVHLVQNSFYYKLFYRNQMFLTSVIFI